MFLSPIRPDKKALSVVSLVVNLLCSAPGLAESPNIILCMGDDHGWDEVGYNSHPFLKTPVLDEMAKTGVRFDQFYSGHPSCSPTRGSFLTGRHPNRYGTFSPGFSIRPEEVTIAHLLKRAGYRCGHFGKWHLGPVKADSPTNPGKMGFDEYVSHDNFFEMNPVLSRNGAKPVQFPGEGSKVIVDETIRFIDRATKDKQPFLAVVWFGSPHEPYSGLERDLKLYDSLPQEYASRKVRLTSMKTGQQTMRPLKDVLRERYAEITAMDRAIGKLRSHLAKRQLRDNTIVFYCSDNGVPRSGRATSPLRGQKGQLYGGGVRVPAVLEWPAKVKKQIAVKANTVTSDLLPTVCEVAGVEVPKSRPIDGVSLLPMLEQPERLRKKPIFFWMYASKQIDRNAKPYIEPVLQEGTTPLVKMLGGRFTRNFVNYHHTAVKPENYAGARSMVSDEFKLILSGSTHDPKVELFHLAKDPNERRNVATEHTQRVARMKRELKQWQTSVLNSLTRADYRK